MRTIQSRCSIHDTKQRHTFCRRMAILGYKIRRIFPAIKGTHHPQTCDAALHGIILSIKFEFFHNSWLLYAETRSIHFLILFVFIPLEFISETQRYISSVCAFIHVLMLTFETHFGLGVYGFKQVVALQAQYSMILQERITDTRINPPIAFQVPNALYRRRPIEHHKVDRQPGLSRNNKSAVCHSCPCPFAPVIFVSIPVIALVLFIVCTENQVRTKPFSYAYRHNGGEIQTGSIINVKRLVQQSQFVRHLIALVNKEIIYTIIRHLEHIFAFQDISQIDIGSTGRLQQRIAHIYGVFVSIRSIILLLPIGGISAQCMVAQLENMFLRRDKRHSHIRQQSIFLIPAIFIQFSGQRRIK